ncbi:hypothetical protein FSARC_12644 [Fusarium sarcochroum]|uniref:Cell wall protein n=1 Tax=Fusarium sarcochroum TaxID=1208366 RepID=A0A8H4T702_9HYPO|nr:hypothetical protein FSARC_12644 [Fusarium sarcochroum]
MHLSSSLATLVALAGLCSADPNGFSPSKSARDSPTKLDDCGCWPIYQAMLKCQKLEGPNADTRKCVCIANPDGWYPSMDGCRNCLSPGSLEDDDFFDNMSRLITQLFVSCTEVGGGVTSDGSSICASNAYRRACVSLGTGGRKSWGSFEVFESKTTFNSSYVLDISEYGADEDESTSKTGKAAKTTATDSGSTTDTSIATGEPSSDGSGTSDSASGTETDPASATTTPSSAMDLAGTRTVAGVVSGMMIAVAVGFVLF